MAKWIDSLPYRLKFDEDGVSLYNGDKLVSHNQIKKTETELEVAERIVNNYLHGKAFNDWLKIVRIVYQVNKSLKQMMTDELWLEFLRGDDAKALLALRRKVLDTSLNEMWVIK